MIAEIVLAVQLVVTLTLVGVIWFVQVVHYPLFARVGREQFSAYELEHQRRTTLVVAPLMLLEASTAVLLLWVRPTAFPLVFASLGVALVVLIWLSTFLVQVPAHERLAVAYEPTTQRRLVVSNWVRTASWTARGLMLSWAVVSL